MYLYLFSAIGLVVAIIGTVRLVDLGMKVLVFGGADDYAFVAPVTEEGVKPPTMDERAQKKELSNQRKRTISESLAMLIVGIPVYLYHWQTIKKETD